MVLDKLSSSLRGAVSKLLGKPLVDEAAISEFLRDVQRALLEADVNVKLVLELTKRIRERALKESPPPGYSRKDLAVKILYDELVSLLGGRPPEFPVESGRTFVILVVGVEGSGKTTTVAKLAHWFSKRYGKVAVVSSDVIRPASHIQLTQMLGGRIPVYWEDLNDPVEIMKRGVERFRKERYNVVLVDTAGRHKEEGPLMEELRQYNVAIHPDLVLLVVDGTIGQGALSQAKAFVDSVDIGGVVVTKLDAAAKGGGALSAVAAAKAPIYFIGTGEGIEDLEPFDPDRFVTRLLGGGDVVELARRVEEAFREADLLERMAKGKFDLEDFREYLIQMTKAGPLEKLIEMIPGLDLRPQDLDLNEIRGWVAMIDSMTPEERRDPSIIKGSRIERIARGSGHTSKDVRKLLKSYYQSKKMMESMSSPAKVRKLLRRMGLA